VAKVNAIVITGYGTNCERETAHAAIAAGADKADVVYFSDLAAGRIRLPDYNFLLFPGGFLDGDDLGAAQAAALRWRHAKTPDGAPILDQLLAFLEQGGIVFGICNGFQLLVKLGLLPGDEAMSLSRTASLSHNDSARFEDRWVWLKTNPDCGCVFTRGVDDLYLPVRHGEGKITFADEASLVRVDESRAIAMQYVDPDTGRPTQDYPYNPNGSPKAIAALTDPSGRILGMMPHPEAFNHPTNHPAWTREDGELGAGLGLRLFEAGVAHLRGA
jgi:phosphoribosylformylglycinamidine synthase